MKLNITIHQPALGDTRSKRHFALMPTIIKTELIWLSFYYVKEQYVHEYRGLYQSENYWRFISYISKTDYVTYILEEKRLNR